MLKRNVERLSAMITSLVETGWLEVAAIPQEARPVGAAEIVSDTVASVRAAFPEAPSIVVDLEERLPPVHENAHRCAAPCATSSSTLARSRLRVNGSTSA